MNLVEIQKIQNIQTLNKATSDNQAEKYRLRDENIIKKVADHLKI